MSILKKNELWLALFALGLLLWLFNPTVPLSLIMIVPILISLLVKK